MPESSDRPGQYDQEQIIDSWDNKCLLNIPKTNCISCLLTTETSEPSANVVRTSRAEAVRGGYMSTEHPVIAWSSEIGIANFQIGVIFINKPQIWVLNNYILTWKTLKTTFHDTITVIFRENYAGFWAMTFHKSTRTDKNAYWEKAVVCVKI